MTSTDRVRIPPRDVQDAVRLHIQRHLDLDSIDGGDVSASAPAWSVVQTNDVKCPQKKEGK